MKISRIKLARMNTGITQWALARALGISEGQLSKLESGRKVPSTAILSAIERELGVSLQGARHPRKSSLHSKRAANQANSTKHQEPDSQT